MNAVAIDLEPITMDLDAPSVERIITNLLSNIVRHTPPDTDVWIRTRATADEVELIVDDDGSGISQADRQRVFQPFEQGTQAASSARPGTGVGLSLLDACVQMHRGSLTIADSPAGGTRATITMHHAPPANPHATTAPSSQRS